MVCLPLYINVASLLIDRQEHPNFSRFMFFASPLLVLFSLMRMKSAYMLAALQRYCH